MLRRHFLSHSSALAAATAFPSVLVDRRIPRADIVIQGGLVYDGTGSPPIEADVSVVGERIERIGANIDTSGAVVIDARGMAVAPGFIDIHSHTDLNLLVDPRAESKVRQGVTTEVTGQDGSSIGPWSDDALEARQEAYRENFGVTIDFRDLRGFFERLTRDPGSINVASMVGAGTVRAAVIGLADRPASDEEMRIMVQHVEAALAAGACGVSSGLEYVPGAFADVRELVALTVPLAQVGLPYTTHMRNEDDRLLSAIEETITVGRNSGIPIQISHLKAQGERNWWKATSVLDLLERARNNGIDVMYDRYPYVAYSTGLSSLFPVWARDGGTDALLSRLDSPGDAERIERDVRDKVDLLGSWDAVQVTGTSDSSLGWAAGKRMGQLARERDTEPYQLLVHLTRTDRNRSGMVGFGMSEENTEMILKHPLGMICSDAGARAIDGPLSSGTPHPRAYGSFPRVLGHYCRERQTMPLEAAVQKFTDMPARRLRLVNRGRVRPNYFADLVVFDPDTVRDEATFENPHQYPTGIPFVLVNGTPVISDGHHTGRRPGRVVRPE